MIDRTVKIVNPEGLHARPSGALVAVALEHESVLRIRCAGREVNGRSILEVIALGATCGSELEFWADGPDAEALVLALATLVESGFDGAN